MAYTSQLPKFLLAIDTETSGRTKGAGDPSAGYQIVSYGAMIIDSVTFETVDEIYVEVQYDPKFGWSDEAEAIHGLSKEHLAANGVTLEDAAFILLSLVSKWMGKEPVVACGHRVHFDQRFVDAMLAEAGCEIWWDRVVLDTAGIGGAFINITGSNFLFAAVGLPPRTLHNSAEDIRYTVEVLKFLKDIFMRGLAHDS